MKSLYFDFETTSGEAFLQEYMDGDKNIWESSINQQRMIKNTLMGMVYQNPILGLRMDYSSASNIAA